MTNSLSSIIAAELVKVFIKYEPIALTTQVIEKCINDLIKQIPEKVDIALNDNLDSIYFECFDLHVDYEDHFAEILPHLKKRLTEMKLKFKYSAADERITFLTNNLKLWCRFNKMSAMV